MTDITYEINKMPMYRNLEMIMWNYFPQSIYRIPPVIREQDIRHVYLSMRQVQMLLFKKRLTFGNIRLILKWD